MRPEDLNYRLHTEAYGFNQWKTSSCDAFQLRFVHDDCDVRLSQRDKRTAELQGEIDRLLNEYQDLFDLKVQLDTELKAYQNLLEGEESRYFIHLW